MRVLITGRGTSGSWLIRGEQLGRAMGATVIPDAKDIAAFDVVVLVKRPTPQLLDRIHKAGVPLVWDVVDAWPQPIGNDWAREVCMNWLRRELREIKPDAIVAATRAMAEDIKLCTGAAVLTLPHHSRPDRPRNPIVRTVRTVAYEGGAHYINEWAPVLRRECAARGWDFVINPPSLGLADIVVALRDHKGYAPGAWKSNVKLANAQGAGIPIICNGESGYLETACGAEVWCESHQALPGALDYLAPYEARLMLSEQLYAARIPLDRVATTYRTWLQSKF